MTPQEKARELVDKMYNTPHCGIEHFPSKRYCDCSEMNLFQAKQCAIVAVDELIDFAKLTDATNGWDHLNYWIQVKHELTKQEQ